MAEATITVRMDVDEAEEALARLEQRAEAVERRVAMAISRLERSEAKIEQSEDHR